MHGTQGALKENDHAKRVSARSRSLDQRWMAEIRQGEKERRWLAGTVAATMARH